MKTRKGFISNSSTSSFIIISKNENPTTEQIHNCLFGGTSQENPLHKVFLKISKQIHDRMDIFEVEERGWTSNELLDVVRKHNGKTHFYFAEFGSDDGEDTIAFEIANTEGSWTSEDVDIIGEGF